MATTNKDDKPTVGKRVAAAGREVHDAGQKLMEQSSDRAAQDQERILASMKRGGKVKRTGLYRLHKGERVKPARKGRGKKSRRGGKGRY
jgi:hypothetical protein